MAQSPTPPLRAVAAVLAALALQGADAAEAGGPSSCGCTPTPSPSSSSSSASSGGFYSYGAASAASTSVVSVTTSLRGAAVANAQALANSVGGGYGSFSELGGVTTSIESVQVEGAEPQRRICTAFRARAVAATVRASCLDDKDVPHPASQVSPDRRVADAFEGEIYRCIAGTRLQYTLATSEAAAEGRSVGCAKGQALWRRRDGALECRAQVPARDCNERSLLRRYGAGVKTVTVQTGQECVAWREEASAPTDGGGLHVELSPGDP
jgi:hypothetical protein